MASFKAKFPVLQELFAKNHRAPPSGARVKGPKTTYTTIAVAEKQSQEK